MRHLALFVCLMMAACSAPSGVGESEQALHPGVVLIAQPKPGGTMYSGWTKSPTNWSPGEILADYNSGNPNASYISAPGGGTFGDALMQITSPSVFTCNSIVSVQSIVAQFKLHTAGANENLFYVDVNDGTAEGEILCSSLPPWRPVGFQFDCGNTHNPITGAAWMKADLGCSGASPLQWGFTAAAVAGITIEAMQIKATVTTL